MKTYWVVGIAMVAGLSTQAEECYVTVYVHTGNSSEGAMLQRAEIQTAAMFREIGVEVRFRNNIFGAISANNACGAPIVMQLDASASSRVSPSALAYATPYAQSGTCIHVFMDRVVERANPSFGTILLAHVLAHEITHVLERVDRHSPDGVLKAHWDSRDRDLMKSHPLPFAAIDVEMIHAGVANRMQQAAVTE